MPRFRFSLWWLMIAITAVCVLLFLSQTVGDFFGFVVVSVLWCILPTPLVILAIFGRDDPQAFAIGALVPWTLIIVKSPFAMSFVGLSIWLPILCTVCGIVAGVTRRWIRANLRSE